MNTVEPRRKTFERNAEPAVCFYDLLHLASRFEKENGMSNSHIAALRNQHAKIDTEISKEERRPSPNAALLTEMKKQKLRIKEAMANKRPSPA